MVAEVIKIHKLITFYDECATNDKENEKDNSIGKFIKLCMT